MFKKIDSMKELFFLEPYRKVGVREAGRIFKINPATASKYLDQLVSEGILKKESERIYKLYSADTQNQKYRDEKIRYNIERIRESGLVDYIYKKQIHPEVIMLFGSFAKGESDKNSDIDIFVLSAEKGEIDLSGFEKKLGCEIQLMVLSRKEFSLMKKNNKELLNNIINGIRLKGYLEVF